ncbi:MAG: hypothetical protein PHO70_05900 [Candidatus Omnitrophica bacterium]|nr:hypothetical protein [Candidatus Omnitrophota bacterium]
MNYQDKLDIIIKTISKEREKDSDNPFISLDLAKNKELSLIPIDEIEGIIDCLRKEKVLILRNITYPKATDTENVSHYALTQQPCYSIEIAESFSNWHSAYILKKSTKLENLSLFNLEKICYLVHDIEEKFEINPNKQIIIKLTTNSIEQFPLLREKCSINSDIIPYRKEALEYLKDHSIISHYEIKHSEYADSEIGILLNVNEFNNFKKEITKIYEDKRKKQNKQIPAPMIPKTGSETPKEFAKKLQREIVYEIKYTENGEIFLNNFLFAKVQFNGENEAVFSYLFKHPNKRITKAEFKEKAGYSVGKPLHKIVENLGFTGNLRKAFFNVSEQAILFRNPLTKKELEKLNIPQLKLKKKAIS